PPGRAGYCYQIPRRRKSSLFPAASLAANRTTREQEPLICSMSPSELTLITSTPVFLSSPDLFFIGTICRPVVHHLLATLEHVAATVCGLDLVIHGVRQRHLRHLVGVVRTLRGPVTERRTKTVHCETRALH